ncbi:MAG: AAA family ATPase, partial [Acidobacteria bacterium]|nr:AAA family ATPase [Acidobacteriota bacterium]
MDLTNEKGELAQWTLILGDNGVGKTTLLQCLVWMRPVLIFDKGSESSDPLSPLSKGVLGSALPEEENDILERLLKIDGGSEIVMSAEVCQENDLVFDAVPTGKNIRTKIKVIFDEKGLLENFEQTRTNIEKKLKNEFFEPFIVAYGANRQMGFQNVTNSELEDPLARRLSDVTELYDAEERLTKLHYAATNKKYRRNKFSSDKNDKKGTDKKSTEERLLETFKQAIAAVLPDEVNSVDVIEIEAPKLEEGQLKESRVKLRTNDLSVPLSDLSLGYKTTLAWVLDLSWRLFNRYPKSSKPLEQPAVVIIDEIDLHLHPLWQWRIMRMLASVFKRTQFIATAHSPLMVQSMPSANFAVIHKVDNEIKIENKPEKVKGWRVDQILNSEYFGIPFSRDPDTEELFKERA